jgi:hypothetical protein
VRELFGAISGTRATYNFVRVHRTLRCAPAMAAGVADRLWSVGQLIEVAEAEEGIAA